MKNLRAWRSWGGEMGLLSVVTMTVVTAFAVLIAVMAWRNRQKRLTYEATLSVEQMNEYHQMRQLGVRWHKVKEMMEREYPGRQRK